MCICCCAGRTFGCFFGKVFGHTNDFAQHFFLYDEFTSFFQRTYVAQHVSNKVEFLFRAEEREHAKEVLQNSSSNLCIAFKAKHMLLAFLKHGHIWDKHKCQLNWLHELAVFHFVNFLCLFKNWLGSNRCLLSLCLSYISHQILKHFACAVEFNSLEDKNFILWHVCENLES